MTDFNEDTLTETVGGLLHQGVNKSEIDQQVTTALTYPRSIKRFHDDALEMATINERNFSVTIEVKRRLKDKNGKRYSPDIIAQTSNAACSIARREVTLRGIPKAMWSGIYEQARTVAMGNVQTLANRRAEAMKVFVGYGIDKQKIFQFLAIKGEEDITLEQLATLRGILTSIKEGEVTPESAFAVQAEAATQDKLAEVRAKLADAAKAVKP